MRTLFLLVALAWSAPCFARSVDIIFVVDSSQSMHPHLEKLSTQAESFFAEIEGLDWSIGIATTNPLAPPVLGFTSRFDKTASNPIKQFSNAIEEMRKRVVNGEEKAFDSVIQTLETHPLFLREGASLVTIFVTDETDHSEKFTGESFYNRLRTLSQQRVLRTYGILGLQEFCGPYPFRHSNLTYSESPYADFFGKTAGWLYRLCETRFELVMKNLGWNIRRGG